MGRGVATTQTKLRSSLRKKRGGQQSADGSLLQTNMDSATASKWMRCILSKQPGSSHDGMSSQGLKATCLSWTMKAAIREFDQDLLDYHRRGKSSSAMSYGRDTLTGLLRSLDTVLLSDIRSGKFRSGRWQSSTAEAARSSVQSKQVSKFEEPPVQPVSDSSDSEEPQSEGSRRGRTASAEPQPQPGLSRRQFKVPLF